MQKDERLEDLDRKIEGYTMLRNYMLMKIAEYQQKIEDLKAMRKMYLEGIDVDFKDFDKFKKDQLLITIGLDMDLTRV